jgi:Tol biopolymer transport system component
VRRRAFGLAVFVLAIAATPSAAPGGRPPALLTFSVNLGPSWASYSYEYRGLCVSRADGSNAFRLTGRRDDRSAAWSPDGTLVAFSRFYDRSRYIGGQEVVSDVFVLNPRSRRLLNVSDGEGVFNVQPAWSPDGRYIAFVAAYQVSVLMVVDLRTNRSWEIGGGAAEPVWSPDGQLIAFIDEYFVGRDPRERREGIFVVRPRRERPAALDPERS